MPLRLCLRRSNYAGVEFGIGSNFYRLYTTPAPSSTVRDLLSRRDSRDVVAVDRYGQFDAVGAGLYVATQCRPWITWRDGLKNKGGKGRDGDSPSPAHPMHRCSCYMRS